MFQNKSNLNILNNKKVYWGAFSVLFLIASIFVGLILSQQTRKTKIGASGVDLTLHTTNNNPRVNDIISVAVVMDTHGLTVNGTELVVKYDPNKLIATSITPGNFLPNVFIPGVISNGTASIVLGCTIDNAGTHPVNGSGLIAQINFTVKTTGTSSITIDSTSKVSVSGQDTSNIGVLTPVQINAVAAATPTPTPSVCGGIQGILCPAGKVCIYTNGTTQPPFPDASGTCQTGSPKPTSTPSPTRSPSPAPTRTPSPVPTRSPSPSPSPFGTGYSMAQIATHNTVSNCWLLMNGKVYNVTNYISSHPGGSSVINSNCGKDATQAFAAIGHSNTAKNLLTQYLIGYLLSANTPTPAATKTPTPSPTNNRIAGDVDNNGIINIVDVGILIDNFGDNPLLDTRPDLNNDGRVNIIDLGIIIDNYPL